MPSLPALINVMLSEYVVFIEMHYYQGHIGFIIQGVQCDPTKECIQGVCEGESLYKQCAKHYQELKLNAHISCSVKFS